MTKNERLLEFIGEVDETLIPSVEPLKAKKDNIRWFTVGGVCTAALIGLVVFKNFSNPPPAIDTNPVPNGTTDISSITSETTSDSTEATTPAPPAIVNGLPTLSAQIQLGAMGFEGYTVYDISELDSNNPWSKNLSLAELPVYRNLTLNKHSGAGETKFYSEEELKQIAEKTATQIGVGILRTESEYLSDATIDVAENEDFITRLSAYCSFSGSESDDVVINIYGGGQIKIEYITPIILPNEYSFSHDHTSNEEAEKTILYLAQQYQNLLQYANPTANTYTNKGFDGENVIGQREYAVYDKSEDIVQSILNYSFCKTGFCLSEENKLWIIWKSDTLASSELIGNYPIIDAKTAESLLLQGYFVSSISASVFENGTIPAEAVEKVELIYRTDSSSEFFQPYYRFLLKLPDKIFLNEAKAEKGLITYGAFYVPAISSEYLTDFPVWDGSFN